MFGIGTTELMVILLVALMVLGPKKLPQIAKSLGKAFGEFRRVSSDVKRTIDTEVDRLEREEQDKKAREELRVEDAKAKAGKDDKIPVKDTSPEPDAPASEQSDPFGQGTQGATAEMDQDENKPHQDASKA